MSDYVEKLQQDLEKKLKCLSWAHNEPALYIVEYFAELRNQVDLDAERLLEKTQSVKRDTGKPPKDSDVNETRLEFIRILDELEKRTGLQSKPQTPASEINASFEKRIDAFKDSSSSLDDLDETYAQLVREITAESDRVEKRLLGEQTIIYWPQYGESELGSLVYFGDLYLNKLEIGCFRSRKLSYEITCTHEAAVCSFALPYDLNKSKQIMEHLFGNNFGKFKFYCVGKMEEDYSGYSAEGSSLERKFISYQYRDEISDVKTTGTVGLDTSANLFDIYSSKRCRLEIGNLRLQSLHVNLLPSPVTRLAELRLTDVHFESFDTNLLACCTNLTVLKLKTTLSKAVKFDLAFLRALTNLETLELTAPLSSSDLNVFQKQTRLRCLKLENSFFCTRQPPKLSKAALEQILLLPRLDQLVLSGFEIEAIDRKMLSRCSQLRTLDLAKSRIARSVTEDACWNLSFPLCTEKPKHEARNLRVHMNQLEIGINLIHCDIRALNVENFAGMMGLTDLLLTGNSIAKLPRGVFQDLPSLKRLDLDNNLIRHIRSGVFGKLNQLWWLNLGHNPIKSIEANAFDQLNYLRELDLDSCRLNSIDSEMFNGLKSLRELRLDNNLIERIEVVAKYGHRINVAKADLSDEEKEWVSEHLLTDMCRLYDLNLRENKLKKLDLNCFSNLTNLQTLSLSSNEINELGGVTGPELLCNLSKLSLNDNQLTTIENSSLPKNLNDLHLSKNKLKRLDDEFLAGFTQLRVVNLAQNELTLTVTAGTFASCRHCLEEINLVQNESISLADVALQEMPHQRCIEYDFNKHFLYRSICDRLRIRELTPEALKKINLDELIICYLSLSNCSIESLTNEPDWKNQLETSEIDQFNLSWLGKASLLQELDLSKNLIVMLNDPGLFTDLTRLSTINLSGNRLSHIHRDIFKCLPHLDTIDLSDNKLSSIDMGLFRHLKSRMHLNISSNNISFLNLARLFRICPRLESLNIADNQLDDRSIAEQIDARTCCFLRTLNLANNRLQTLHFVQDMINLRHLDLRDNMIDSIMSNGENMLVQLNKLTRLNLSRNRIGLLKDEMFAHLRYKLDFLDLSGNPIDFQLDSVLLELI